MKTPVLSLLPQPWNGKLTTFLSMRCLEERVSLIQSRMEWGLDSPEVSVYVKRAENERKLAFQQRG